MDSGLEQALPVPPGAVMEIGAEDRRAARWRHAAGDLQGGFALWRLGVTLGWLDIKLRYRGSVLGPFWLTLSTGVMVGGIGVVYGTLFHMDLHGYLPFLALSLVLWNAISALVTDACNTFTQSEAMIRSFRMPYFVHAQRVVVRSAISLAHNVPVILVVFAAVHAWPGMAAFGALPGLALWLLDAFAACLLLGTFCARFRDIPQIVNSLMTIAFYVTPIIWRPEQMGRHAWLLVLNPFFATIEIVRAPLLGAAASSRVWEVALISTAGLCGLAWLLFARLRGRIAFWM
jgi:lipopolysaccharide transport system permease protein